MTMNNEEELMCLMVNHSTNFQMNHFDHHLDHLDHHHQSKSSYDHQNHHQQSKLRLSIGRRKPISKISSANNLNNFKMTNQIWFQLWLAYITLVTLLLLTTTPVHASGFFELHFLDGVRNSSRIHVCLKEFWNSQINFNRCTFGQKTIVYNTDQFGHNHHNHHQPHSYHHNHNHNHLRQSTVKIPFSFRWIGSFSFTIQLTENSAHSGVNRFVVEDEFAVPSVDWKFRSFHAQDGRIISLRFRISCDLYYHSEDCATFCRARNDTFGHYTCDSNGRQVCLDGWKGKNCDIPKCSTGCNEVHGYCNTPNECICKHGWKGSNCDECVRHPGCLHGYCLSPFQCICHRNWGGILCDQDLNYCGTHEPCLNEGRCENIAPNNYRCACKKGFSGVNCQIVEDACATSPCLHGGSCQTLANGTEFVCHCRKGFAGDRCERDLNECATQPCLNGGTCHDLENDFRCTCPSGWTGERCEQDVNECSALVTPCIRASACINVNGSYICVCEKGFEGAFCEIEIDDCEHNKVNCKNGGLCIDLINDYRCVCATGFTGPDCTKIDSTVCELIPNHVWHYNDSSNCENVCVCQENSTVLCTCQQPLNNNIVAAAVNKSKQCNGTMELTTGDDQDDDENQLMMMNKLEINVMFDSVASEQSCDTIYAIHTLISQNNVGRYGDASDEDTTGTGIGGGGGGGGYFCCHATPSTNELVIRVDEKSQLANYISRTVFPHILHLVVNTKHLEPRHTSMLLDWFISLLVTACLAALYLALRTYRKRKRQQLDATNTVIHCIQNNLQSQQSSLHSSSSTTKNHHSHQHRHLTSLTPIEGKKLWMTAASSASSSALNESSHCSLPNYGGGCGGGNYVKGCYPPAATGDDDCGGGGGGGGKVAIHQHSPITTQMKLSKNDATMNQMSNQFQNNKTLELDISNVANTKCNNNNNNNNNNVATTKTFQQSYR